MHTHYYTKLSFYMLIL